MPRAMMVTGAAGFIGANFVRYWVKAHPDDVVVGYDKLTYAGNIENLTPFLDEGKIYFVRGDINDFEQVIATLSRFQIDTIVHFAAESHVDRSIAGPDAFIETNIVGTHTLLKAARRCWLDGRGVAEHRFHHVSTDEVYGSLNPDEAAFHEAMQYRPNSPYSASKAASDHLVRVYHHTYGLRVTTSNCSNNYGPYHYPEKLIPLCITHLLLGRPVPVYGDGSNIRDWLYVEDHCRGIELVLRAGRCGETYNIGGNNEYANLEVVKYVCREVDRAFARDISLRTRFPRALAAAGRASEQAIEFVDDRAGHDWRYAIDARKVTAELGYQPQQTFASGIRRTVEWYLHNEPWWRDLLKNPG